MNVHNFCIEKTNYSLIIYFNVENGASHKKKKKITIVTATDTSPSAKESTTTTEV